jgi:hypothetical protein
MGFRDYLNESKPTVEDYLKSIKKVFPYIEKMHTDVEDEEVRDIINSAIKEKYND